jgi:hypothetical protein
MKTGPLGKNAKVLFDPIFAWYKMQDHFQCMSFSIDDVMIDARTALEFETFAVVFDKLPPRSCFASAGIL